ncbi:MAG: hypothetical protein KJN82_04735 [Bacteroidia bacterium]|nr:hypothetical protein [Bacteroidia bacterium]
MQLNGLICTLPKELKLLIGAFVIILSIGFYTGLLFVSETSSTNPSGIEEHYLGNEENEDANIMKFKKSNREMLTLVHNHVISMSFIFFLLGLIMIVTKLNLNLKLFLILEPFLSIVLTFGGLYLMWSGVFWFKYIVMLSGILMTLCFTVSVCVIFRQLFMK